MKICLHLHAQDVSLVFLQTDKVLSVQHEAILSYLKRISASVHGRGQVSVNPLMAP